MAVPHPPPAWVAARLSSRIARSIGLLPRSKGAGRDRPGSSPKPPHLSFEDRAPTSQSCHYRCVSGTKYLIDGLRGVELVSSRQQAELAESGIGAMRS